MKNIFLSEKIIYLHCYKYLCY